MASLRRRLDRVRTTGRERGASAIEWVVIAAVVVGIVLAVGFVISEALSDKADEVQDCISGADHSSEDC